MQSLLSNPTLHTWLLDILKQLLITMLVNKNTTVTAAVAGTANEKSSSADVFDGRAIAVLQNDSGAMCEPCALLRAFRNNPGNTIAQESDRVRDLLIRLDWPGTQAVLRSSLDDLFGRLSQKTGPGALLLAQLDDSLNQIQGSYIALLDKMQLNAKKWAPSWRTTNYEPLLRALGRDYEIFQKRLRMFERFFSQQLQQQQHAATAPAAEEPACPYGPPALLPAEPVKRVEPASPRAALAPTLTLQD